MIIRENIDADYIAAYKSKDTNAKAALSSIKAAITIAEKNNGTWIATNDEIIKIINKGIKQREESIKMYDVANRPELSKKESDEIAILRRYMPAQMTPQEIVDALTEIMQGFAGVITNPQALQGKTIGEFNKRYQGRAEIGMVKSVLANLVDC
jgi:uncharacterized protein YqeY